MKLLPSNSRIEKKEEEERFICPACIGQTEIYNAEKDDIEPCHTCSATGIISLAKAGLSNGTISKLTTVDEFNRNSYWSPKREQNNG